MHYMLVNLLHSHYIQHVMYVITYPLHAFEDANESLASAPGLVSLRVRLTPDSVTGPPARPGRRGAGAGLTQAQ